MVWGSINNTVNTRSARLWFGDIVFFCSLQDRILLFDIQLLKKFSFFFTDKISEENHCKLKLLTNSKVLYLYLFSLF